MKKILYSVCLLALCLAATTGCKRKAAVAETLPHNPFVEAFTAGKISRFTPVYLVLNQDIAPDKMLDEQLKKQIKIKPAVDGEFVFENSRTIAFRPSEKGMERNTAYTVTADLEGWFDAEAPDRKFTFGFETFPLAVRANLEALNINESNETGYDVVYLLMTPDREKPETVEGLIGFSESVTPVWSHDLDGRKHRLTLHNVAAGRDGTRTLNLSVVSNKYKVPKDVLLSVDIPAANDFSVYGTEYKTTPEKYIEVTFTKNLDPGQNLQGLAYIEGNRNETVGREGNKVRLYPDPESKGILKVHLDAGIRSQNGLTLQKEIVRQVEVSGEAPAVRFIGDGVIIPRSPQLLVPFQAIWLRGVVVHVVKVMQNNIGQFLQQNNLDGADELARVGRLVSRKTIFFDEDTSLDLSQWNTFAVDLGQMIEPEPGAIYRIELSFNRDLSVFPCENCPTVSKEQLLAQDEIRLKEELVRYDEGYYYYDTYYVDGFSWANYNYKERKNPCSESFYSNTRIGKNVLATNLGLIAKAGADNRMTVLVHDLITTDPVGGVTVTAYNFQHQPVGHAVTGDKGDALLTLTGKPFYLIAAQGTQRSYLRVGDGTALSVSSFDVAGEVVQKGIKGFIYGDRGVWRPGDTLFLSFMLNDRLKTLPPNHPVTLELFSPLGQSYARRVQTQGQLGVYSFRIPTDSDAPTGAWSVSVNVGGAAFSKRIRIESIKPNRLKIDLKVPDKVLLRGEPLQAQMHVEWLQGATARNLAYDIQGTFVSTKTAFPKYPGFSFENPIKLFDSEESQLISGRTDENGNATIEARFEVGSSAPGMLTANFVTRVYEESGDFSIDAFRMQYSPYHRYVGVKSPQQNKEPLNTGSEYTYEVATVDHLGSPSPRTEVEVEVYKVQWYWWWSSDKEQLGNFVSDSYNQAVKRLTLTTDAAGKGSFRLSFPNSEWGTYFIVARDRSGGHSAGILSYYDWPYNEGRRDAEGGQAATTLSFKTDKDTYAPGEKMVVTFPSSQGSRAVVSIENGSRVLSISEFECRDRETTVKLDVTDEMQPNAYVHITLLQPHGITRNDLPIRLYGIVPVTVTSPKSHLDPVIGAPAEVKPESRYEIAVSEKSGREMAYTLAIVDEGLLDLTRFQTPDPWRVFNAREALGVNTWDLYNYVVGAYGGRIEQLFSIGGDDALNRGPKAIVNRFKPVVEFAGPFLLKKGEKKRHKFDMPNYNGRVRIMVVAGDGEAYGRADASMMVRKPVMVLGTLPRVIGINEEMVVPATVFTTEDGVGSVRVSIACSDNMEVMGEASRELNFTRKDDKQALFRIRVKGKPGAGHIILTATGKGDKSVYETDIEIRSVRRPQTRVIPVTLEPGGSWKETVGLPGMEGTNRLTLEVSNVQPVNLAWRLDYLLGYPHGCIEQITSKGFPQLYVKQFAVLSKEQAQLAEESVKEALRRMRSFQTVDGAFSYWPGGTDTYAWATAYASHFMLEAEAKGFLVPDALKQNALNNLRRVARDWKPVSNYYAASEEMTQAYRLFVLALGNSPELGAMNRLRENNALRPMSRWMLAAAYARTGRADVAGMLVEKTADFTFDLSEYDQTFGSDLRDQSIRLLTLCMLNKGNDAAVLAKEVSAALGSDEWMSTQTTAFALMAFSEYLNRYKTSESLQFSYSCADKSGKVDTPKNIWSEILLDKSGSSAPVELKNTGRSTLFARIITEGIPDQGDEETYANGLELAVSYTDRNGTPVDVSELAQGVNFTAVVTVRNPSPRRINHVALTQIFPAGWEILNTRFLNEGATDVNAAGVNYQDIRDDRVYSYIDNLPSGRQVTVRINLCAVYPGRFYLPPVYAEAMYDRLTRANTEGRLVNIK